MKKVALSTKEEKVLTDIVLTLGVTYLKRFTKKELNKFKNKPVIIPSGDYRFFVGPYVVNGLQKDCWQVKLDGRLIHNFLSKINAFLYFRKLIALQIYLIFFLTQRTQSRIMSLTEKDFIRRKINRDLNSV